MEKRLAKHGPTPLQILESENYKVQIEPRPGKTPHVHIPPSPAYARALDLLTPPQQVQLMKNSLEPLIAAFEDGLIDQSTMQKALHELYIRLGRETTPAGITLMEAAARKLAEAHPDFDILALARTTDTEAMGHPDLENCSAQRMASYIHHAAQELTYTLLRERQLTEIQLAFGTSKVDKAFDNFELLLETAAEREEDDGDDCFLEDVARCLKTASKDEDVPETVIKALRVLAKTQNDVAIELLRLLDLDQTEPYKLWHQDY